MSKNESQSGAVLPAPGEGKRGEDGYLGYLLRQAAHAYQKRSVQALADLAVTPPQFSVMTMIAAYPGVSSADLARLALLTPQTVSVIVANLEKTEAVARRPHAVHGRIQHLELTEKGRGLLAEARKRVHTLEAELAVGLSPEEAAAVRRWLVRVAKPMSPG